MADPQNAVLQQNGTVIDNPIAKLLADITVTYHLDGDGRLLSVEGFDDLEERVIEQLPPAYAAQLGPMFDPDFLANKEESEWNSRIGSFIGLENTRRRRV